MFYKVPSFPRSSVGTRELYDSYMPIMIDKWENISLLPCQNACPPGLESVRELPFPPARKMAGGRACRQRRPLEQSRRRADPTRGGSVSYFPHEADLKLANRVASGDRVDPGDCLRHDLLGLSRDPESHTLENPKIVPTLQRGNEEKGILSF